MAEHVVDVKKSSLINEVRIRGPLFIMIFLLFFLMAVLPLLGLLYVSLTKSLIALFIIFLLLVTLIIFEAMKNNLFGLCVLLVVQNVVLWFLLGLLTFFKDLFFQLPGFSAYLLLTPYAVVSGFLVFYLFWKASKDAKKTMYGGVIISLMLAVTAAMTNLIHHLAESLKVRAGDVALASGFRVDEIISLFGNVWYNPIAGFFVVFFLFNVPFVKQAVRKEVDLRLLLWYALPILIFFLLK